MSRQEQTGTNSRGGYQSCVLLALDLAYSFKLANVAFVLSVDSYLKRFSVICYLRFNQNL